MEDESFEDYSENEDEAFLEIEDLEDSSDDIYEEIEEYDVESKNKKKNPSLLPDAPPETEVDTTAVDVGEGVGGIPVNVKASDMPGDIELLENKTKGDIVASEKDIGEIDEATEKRQDESGLAEDRIEEMVGGLPVAAAPLERKRPITGGGEAYEHSEERDELEEMRIRMKMTREEFYAAPDEADFVSALPIFDGKHVKESMKKFNDFEFRDKEERIKAYERIIAAAKRFGISTKEFEEEADI